MTSERSRNRGVREGRETYLAVIECAFDGKVVHVGICHRRHLRFLDGRDAALGMQDEYGDVRLVPETIYCGAAVRKFHQYLR